MSTQTIDVMTEHLTEAQREAFDCFRERLDRRFPEYRIRSVEPLEENMIRVWLESIPETYKKGLAVSKLAVEVQEETGIYIFPR